MVRLLTTLLFSLLICEAPAPSGLPAVKWSVPDGRMVRLETFFHMHGCPAPYHTTEYLRAADRYGLDYRLLPAISVRESTCGQYCRLNNYWGWDSARTGFTSVPSGINYIAKQLTHGVPYRGASLDQKIRRYNPVGSYASSIKKLMREIDKEPVVSAYRTMFGVASISGPEAEGAS